MSEEGTVEAPDERALRAHLKGAKFRAQEHAGCWHLIELSWPNALIAVSAAARENAPSEFLLRFELSGYPQTAPMAGLWDASTNTPLAAEQRPKGERTHVFRADWEGGLALYAPWDRTGLRSHPEWATKHPRYAWHAQRDLSFYLKNVHDILNEEAYVGI